MTLKVELSAELEKRLAEEAARNGQAPEEFALQVIEARLTETESEEESPYAGLPRRDPKELYELARKQGARLSLTAEDLRADFWPEEDSIDEFLETIRELRGRPSAHPKE